MEHDQRDGRDSDDADDASATPPDSNQPTSAAEEAVPEQPVDIEEVISEGGVRLAGCGGSWRTRATREGPSASGTSRTATDDSSSPAPNAPATMPLPELSSSGGVAGTAATAEPAAGACDSLTVELDGGGN